MSEQFDDMKIMMQRRAMIVRLLFGVVGFLIFLKMIYVQYGPSAGELRSLAVDISFNRVDIEAERGDVLARDGRILVASFPMYELRMDFDAGGITKENFEKDVDELSACMANFFKDKSKAKYAAMFRAYRRDSTHSRYKMIAPRKVDHVELLAVSKFPILNRGANRGGFMAIQINNRLKPHGALARRTIGGVNQVGDKYGIEGAFDKELSGEKGNSLMQKISGSFWVPVVDPHNEEPVNGLDVVTTLDVDIQDLAESELKKQLEKGKANWGSVVLMEVETGEIRAMTNITRTASGDMVEDYNYAVGMAIEPGSTFKLATLISLLEQTPLTLTDSVDTGNGTEWIGRGRSKAKVVDSHGVGKVSIKEAFEVSTNVGFAKLVDKYYGDNPVKFVNSVCDLGFDKRVGIEISGAADPIVKRPKDKYWDGTSLVRMAFGYALNITPLHTLMLYNAVANNGKMVQPMVVTELKEHGVTVEKFKPRVLNKQICSQETLAEVKECLEGVVDDGTARILKSPYYKVAAKTGTAQIAQGKYGYKDARGGRHYLATLVGYFPIDKPKYSCIVVVKTYYGPGSYGTYYGASLAGPVFKAVADRVYASHTQWQQPVNQVEGREKQSIIPIKGGDVKQIYSISKEFSANVDIDGEKRGWATIEMDSAMNQKAIKESLMEGIVPNVIGCGLKESLYLLEKSGLKVAFSGKGRVVSQSRKSGAKCRRGELISIKLK